MGVIIGGGVGIGTLAADTVTPISLGGTGQTTAPLAINALLPVQTGLGGRVLGTDGTVASWVVGSGGGGTPGGLTTQVQYNDTGAFAGNAAFTFNSATGVLSATGFSGSGVALTALNATNLTTGTVGTARLGTGPADATTFLSGDGTWKVVATNPDLVRTTVFDAAAKGTRVAISAGVTIPAATYTAGTTFSFYNDSAAAITITQGAGLTMRLDGTALTGNRTLAARGTCLLWYNSASEAIISGSLT